MGWRLAVVWECALRNPEQEALIDDLSDWLLSDEPALELPAN